MSMHPWKFKNIPAATPMRKVLRLDAAGRAAAIETITNPPDVYCVTNDWVPEMFAYLEAGLGRALPNLEIDRTPAGYQHAGGFAG